MYYIRKAAGLLVTLLLVSLLTFLVFQILPGNPVDIILGVDADPVQVEQLTQELGLNQPASVRYLQWIHGLFKGDLGTSIRYHQPVAELLQSSLKVTGMLAILAFCLTILIGIPLGIFVAAHSKKRGAAVVNMGSQLTLSIPSFCMAIFLIDLFSVKLGWFPSLGYVPWSQDPAGCLRSLFLPALSISLGSAAVVVRYVRVSIMGQAKQDYARTARSKGLSERAVIYRHVLRNSMIPVITILGMTVADVLGGSIIIENVFSLPGIGHLINVSINTRDLPLIQGLVLYLAVIVTVCNFVVDIVYSILDPRIRLG